MAENQEDQQVKPNDERERQIPVLTVLKNNCILKNIFVMDSPSTLSSQESEEEEVLLVGRHPDCNIKLEHPSNSRFHLRINSKPSSRSLQVTDLSSVHGTWVSGKRIEQGVRIKLEEGDTLRLGASSRLYRLHWVPLSYAYDMDKPFVPQLDAEDSVGNETEEAVHQDENSLPCENDQVQTLSDDLDDLEQLFSDAKLDSSVSKMTPFEPVMPDNLNSSFSTIEEAENYSSPGMFNQENENSLHRSLSLSVSQTVSQLGSMKTQETSGMKSEKRSGMSIWSRRGKPESVLIETSLSRRKSARAEMSLQFVDENYTSESILNDDHSSSPDHDLQIFTSDKENCSPRSLKKSKGEEMLKSEPISNTSVSSLDRDEDEIFTPDKENMTPNTRLLRSMKNIRKFEVVKYPKLYRSSPLKGTDFSNLYQEETMVPSSEKARQDRDDLQIFTPDKGNLSPKSFLVRSSKMNSKGEEMLKSEPNSNTSISSLDLDEDEIFTPDKENITPNTRPLRSMENIGKFVSVNYSKSHISSPLKGINCSNLYQEATVVPSLEKASEDPKILQECKSANSILKCRGSLKKQPTVLKPRSDRDPFRPLPVNSISNNKANSSVFCQIARSDSKSLSYREFEMVEHPHKNPMKVEKKRWTIVVDTACLLNTKSRKELQLLRGLKGTTLVIPRIVVRELDCMLRRRSFFTRTTEVSAALQWIEDCMANTRWWIHVQNSAEEGRLVPPTPPASPHWLCETNSAFSVASVSFSSHSLQEIITPVAQDHILEYALLFKQTKSDGQLVLLSDDVALKIKAMAEGVNCETAEEFRKSLVNPFSERFLFTDSSPRGPTWSCADDALLKEQYYPSPSNKLSKPGEGLKGLKLILLHNSSFRQNTPVS